MAVVDGTDDDGAVDVAFEEGDEHFLAAARHEAAAPVGAGQGLGHAHPGAGGFIGGGVLAAGVVQAAGRGVAARPGKLQLDAVVAVGGDGLAGHAHDDGRLRAVHGGLGMQPQAVFVVTQGAVRRVGGKHDGALAVQRGCVLCSVLLAVEGVRERAHEGAQPAGGVGATGGGAQIARGLMVHGEHGPGAASVDLLVVGQGEGGGRCQGAHGADGVHEHIARAQGFELLGVVVTPGLTETPSHSRAVGNQLLPVNGAADVAEACANASRSIGAPASAVSSGGSSTAGLR